MNKLTHAEAARMITVLDDALEKISILSQISPLQSSSAFFQSQALQEPANKPAFEALLHLKATEENYENALFGRGNDIAFSAAETQNATRRLCRVLGSNTPILAALAKSTGPAQESRSVNQCVRKLHELKQNTLTSLATTVEQEQAKNEFMNEVRSKTRQAEDDKQALQMELRRERAEKEQDLTYQNDIISKLRAEFQDIKQTADIEAEALGKETRDEEIANLSTHEDVVNTSDAKLSKLDDAVISQSASHTEKEEALRKKSIKAEMEVHNWIEKYDKELMEKAQDARDLRKLHRGETSELNQLSEYFTRIDRDRLNETQELDEIAKARLRHEEYLNGRHTMAARIQAMMRGVWARRRLLDAKKAKKKKKKKKKKKRKK